MKKPLEFPSGFDIAKDLDGLQIATFIRAVAAGHFGYDGPPRLGCVPGRVCPVFDVVGLDVNKLMVLNESA